MLQRFLIFFCVTLALSACYGNKKPKKPDNLISEKEMVNILMDIKIMASATGKNKNILDENGIHQEDFIYKKYNIDSLQFALSNEYYSYYLVQYESIYAKVNDSLSILKELYSLQNEREIAEKRIQDSLAKIASDTINETIIDTLVNRKELLINEDLKTVVEEIEGLIEPVSENENQPQ
ncbi:hypothetical protein APS56_12340 [Pseudalgibacter alginicilyticus]|uniref:DUF4296 domain-containing protein n=1 Tax=Pseudalgibacter alginicilyticus TaxID=1736674 RepID=A0A0N7HYQ0_9FLAO|nr:DUF4296 domain-containing protein [Pseudalgibacter alginicilyticus]ALJ05870.1 hypothetical protein APS56_12340 [Pseudalgibacter alginicilyticus]